MFDEISEKFIVIFLKLEDIFIVDIGLEDFVKLKNMLEKDKRDSSLVYNFEFIIECIWQEMKIDNNKLMQYYFRLLKIRLIGISFYLFL